jgi:hypothetical protein
VYSRIQKPVASRGYINYMAARTEQNSELDQLLRQSEKLSKRSLQLTSERLDKVRLEELRKTSNELIYYSDQILSIVDRTKTDH